MCMAIAEYVPNHCTAEPLTCNGGRKTYSVSPHTLNTDTACSESNPHNRDQRSACQLEVFNDFPVATCDKRDEDQALTVTC